MADKISIFETSTSTTNGQKTVSKTPRPAPGPAWVKGTGKNKNFWVKPKKPTGDVAWNDAQGWVSSSTTAAAYEMPLAIIKSDAELQGLFDEAWADQKAGKEWSKEKFGVRLQATNWYKTKSESQRKYYTLANDPAQAQEFNSQVTDKKSRIQYLANVNGINVSAAQLEELSRTSLQLGYTDEQLVNVMADYIGYAEQGVDNVIGSLVGRSGDAEDEIRDWAKRNGVTVSNSWVIDQVRSAAKSNWDIGKAKDYVTTIAKQEFSHWADKLDADTSIDDLAVGFKQMYADEMDTDFKALDINNQFIRKAMQLKDDKGMPVNTDIARKELYKTDDWSNVTKNKNKIVGAGQALLSRMGIY